MNSWMTQADQRHPEIEVAVKLGDERAQVELPAALGDARHGIGLHKVGENEFTRAVDPVEEHHEQRHVQEIAIAQHQANAAEQLGQGLGAVDLDCARSLRNGGTFRRGEEQRGAERGSREDHEAHRRERFRRHLRELGAGQRAQVGAQHDHHEQSLAAPDVERVCRESPHLGNDHDAVDTHPDEKRNCNGNLIMGEHGEQRKREHEEQGDGTQQSRTVEVMSQPAIKRHDEHEHERHRRHRIRARFGRKLGQHEGFAQCLHDLV